MGATVSIAAVFALLASGCGGLAESAAKATISDAAPLDDAILGLQDAPVETKPTPTDAGSEPVMDSGADSGSCPSGTLITVARASAWLAVDATHAYWTDALGVVSVPLEGGSPMVVAGGQAAPWGIALGSGRIYWTDLLKQTVAEVLLDGGGKTVLATSPDPQTIAVDATDVYWLDARGSVLRAGMDGGSPTTLASGQSGPAGIAIDSTSVYWTNWTANGTVMEVSKSGGTPLVLASGQDEPHGIAVDGTSVYWTTFGDGHIRSAPIGGGSTTAIASGQSAPRGIALDNASVYWTNEGDGTVRSAPLGGGPVRVLACGQLPWGIAVGASNLYWIDRAIGVMKIPK